MSWLTGAINAFASGIGGAVVTSATQKTDTQKSDAPKEVKQAAIKADKSAQSIKPKWGGFAPTLEVDVFVPDPREGPTGSGTQLG